MTWLRRLWLHFFVRRNPNQKCPACGNKKGEIRWIPSFTFALDTQDATGAVVHRCKVCTAMWGERPLVARHLWNVSVDPGDWTQPTPEKVDT